MNNNVVYDYRIANFDNEGNIAGLNSEIFKTYEAAKKELKSHVDSQKAIEGTAMRVIQDYGYDECLWEAPPVAKPWIFDKPLYYTCSYTEHGAISGYTVRAIFKKHIRK